MNNKVLKVLGITALLGFVGWYAYKKLHKSSSTGSPSSPPLPSSSSPSSPSSPPASIGLGGSGSIGTNTYQTITSSGSIKVKIFKTRNPNDYIIVERYGGGESLLSATMACAFLPNMWDIEKCMMQRLGQGKKIKVYKSAIGTSQYNNNWW